MKSTRRSAARTPTPAADTRPRLIPPQTAPAPTETESVADFLARGGTIEQLDQGARGQPVVRRLQDRHTSEWQAFKLQGPSRRS